MYCNFKRVALVNDLCGYGKTSLAVSIPILTVMGIETSPLPTAILSNHTGYDTFFFDDYTDKMAPYIKEWEKLNVEFDMIYSGFLGSQKQISIITDMISTFNCNALVDPVMGDDGKVYSTYSKEMCSLMKNLCNNAYIITPNVTEACILSDTPYSGENISKTKYENIIDNLIFKKEKNVIITGLKEDNIAKTIVYDKISKKIYEVKNKLCDCYFSGTGDVFASIVCGMSVNGYDILKSVEFAANFIEDAAFYSKEKNADPKDGILLSHKIKNLI